MTKRLALAVLWAFAWCAPAWAFADDPLTNASIINLKQSGVSDASLISIVQHRPGNYDLSAGAIASLRHARVGDDVIRAMMTAMAPPAPHQTAAPMTQADGNVHVFLVTSSGRSELKQGDIAPKHLAEKLPMLSGLIPIPATSMTTRIQYGIKGTRATVSTDASPVFEMDVAGARGIDPAHFTPVILRLQPDGDDRRAFGVQTTISNPRTSVNTVNPIADDRVPVKVDALGGSRFRITPAQPLPPGEYGIAMRDPDVQPVTYSSSHYNASQTQGMSKQQMYQAIVWDFSVGGAR